MPLGEKGGCVPEELAVFAFDPLVGVACVRQEEPFLLRAELVQFIQNGHVHVVIVASERLVELLQVARRLDFLPERRTANSVNSEPARFRKRPIHRANGLEEIEASLVREAHAIGIVLKGGIQQARIVSRRREVIVQVPLLVARNRLKKDGGRQLLNRRFLDKLLVELKRLDGGMQRVIEDEQIKSRESFHHKLRRRLPMLAQNLQIRTAGYI